jgi:hypothetical protein
MGFSWQQGPLAPMAIGRFLVPVPLPERLLYAEPLRRPGQPVIPPGKDRDLSIDELTPGRKS